MTCAGFRTPEVPFHWRGWQLQTSGLNIERSPVDLREDKAGLAGWATTCAAGSAGAASEGDALQPSRPPDTSEHRRVRRRQGEKLVGPSSWGEERTWRPCVRADGPEVGLSLSTSCCSPRPWVQDQPWVPGVPLTRPASTARPRPGVVFSSGGFQRTRAAASPRPDVEDLSPSC